MNSCSLRDWLVGVFRGYYYPRPPENAWQWGEKNIMLRPEESQDYSGLWESSVNPYVRFMMEFTTGQFSENIEFLPGFENCEWEEFIQMKSSQTGFTLAVLIIIAFIVAVIRKNVLYAIDSRDEARRISKSRLQPILQDCAATRARISEDEDDMSNLTLFLLGLIVYLIGAHSEGAFANKSCSFVFVDEADVHPKPEKGMPETVDLSRDRLKAAGGGKLFLLSKPKTEADVTYREYKTGTQHKCFVPCPHCDHYQELVWERVRFDHCKDLAGEYDAQRVERETFYECELCHKPIHERDKAAMIARHRWRQTNPRPKPGKISAHISDLYSPFGKSAWGKLAVEWIEAQKSVTKLIKFMTSRLGLPWRLQTSERTASDILNLRASYPRGTCPITPFFSCMAADTQDDVKKWVKGSFAENGDLYIVDWGHTLSFEELNDLLVDPIPLVVPIGWSPAQGLEGVGVDHAKIGIIDEGGHLGSEVRRFCLRSAGKWWPSKGRGGIQVRKTVNESVAQVDGVDLIVYHFDDDDFKKQLYINRIGKAQKIRDGKEKLPTIYLPEELTGEFIDELMSEKLAKEKDHWGFTREKWKKDPSVPNDWGDAIKNLLVIWYVMAPYLLAAKAEAENARRSESEREPTPV
jgi:phage terminase large subunit GpA-like protein